MLIERKSQKFVAFQPIAIAASAGTRKVGFICEADTIGEAMSGVVQLVAAHCTSSGQHPGQLLTRVEIK